MIKQNKLKIGLILTSALLIASCGGDSDTPKSEPKPVQPTLGNKHTVVIQMAVYKKGSQVGFAPQAALNKLSSNYYPSTQTDLVNLYYKDNLYRIGKKDIDLIQKYNIKVLAKGSYDGPGFSLNDKGVTTSANAHDMAFLNDTKAYITRYGENKAWIVNPSVQNASQFKTGELDLSAYLDTTNGNKATVPHMDNAVIANNKLFISLQRLGDSSNKWSAVRAGYVAVFDTNNDTEINTGKGKNGLKGIELSIKNPQSTALAGDYLYVSGLNYSGYDAGIEKINTTDYTSTLIYDDKETDPTPNNGLVVGKVSGVAVISGTDVYTSIYHKYQDNSLAKVKNGELEVVKSFEHKNIGFIKTGPDGDLWVGTGLKGEEQPKLYRLSKTDLSIKDSVQLPLNPIGITFIKQ